MKTAPPPRLFCIPAVGGSAVGSSAVGRSAVGRSTAGSSTVAVIRRGPSDWCQLGRWDVAAGSFQAGSWIRGKIFPQRCDLSPDGRWVACTIFKGNADWELGDSYLSISRLPWLEPLVAWGLCGTWSRGYRFTERREAWPESAPAVGDPAPLRARYGLEALPAAQFAVERRRGWVEAPDSEPRDPGDVWDERRDCVMEKPQPGPEARWTLTVRGHFAAFRDCPDHRPSPRIRYRLHDSGGGDLELDDLQWADWDPTGRLRVATRDGELQVRRVESPARLSVEQSHPLAELTPDPAPAPAEAGRW